MLVQRKLIVSLVLTLLIACVAASANAHPMVYVITAPTGQQFGTVDLITGAFHQIGPSTPEPEASLVPGPNGVLLSLTFSGNLESINPNNGSTSVIGATGLGDSANELAELNGKVYATDINNNLYRVNTTNGAATLIGPTGIPAVPSGDLFDESLSGIDGKIYATFDALSIPCLTPTIAPELYQINPSTGVATPVASTQYTLMANLSASVYVNGTFYVFKELASGPSPPAPSSGRVFTLGLMNGNIKFVSNIDTTAMAILGASPVPPGR
jgi:hypothetical protein